MTHQRELEIALRALGCYAAEPSADILRLERWCALFSDIAIGFALGFIAVAALTW